MKMTNSLKNIYSTFFHTYFTRLFLISLGFIWCFNLPVSAQDTLQKDTLLRTLREDRSEVKTRRFNETDLDNYRNEKDFQYDRQVKKPTNLNLFNEIIMWIYDNFLRHLYEVQDGGQTRIIFLIICIGLVIFAILRLTQSDWLSLFLRRGKKTKNPDFEDITENIHELDFDKLIAESIASQNYTRSTRLLYLKILKKLTDKNLIDWQLHKTNEDYTQELAKRPYASDFRRLTFLFEYICYGDFKIELSQFQQVQQTFKNFEQKI